MALSLPKEWRVNSVGEEEIELTAICDVMDEEHEFIFYLVNEDGEWKLDYLYNIGRMNKVQIEKTAQALMAASLLGSSWDNVAEITEPYDLSLITYYCFFMSDYSEIRTQSFRPEWRLILA